MKITFDDKSFVEVKKSESSDKIILIICAKDKENIRKNTINAVELTKEEFKKLVEDV
jgi:hypothetical protein